MVSLFFFFKQKTAYEMRISDWSSDVCSSDLMPEADAAVRATIDAEARERGWPALHAELARIDPDAAARIHATDAQRIQRALEVFRLSGRPISQDRKSVV